MHLNLDIWHEIISYFEYPEDEDTLRSLALLSKMTSDLALDAIWRNGERFLTIVSVINSFAPSRRKPFLKYYWFAMFSSPDPDDTYNYGFDSEETEESDEEGTDEEGMDEEYREWSPPEIPFTESTWVVNGPLPDAVRNRALEYLARIRTLKLVRSWPIRKKDLLFPILATCLECPGALFPRLRHLEIEQVHDARSARVDCIMPVISPALKILKITTGGFSEDDLMLPILDLAKTRGCDLEVFTYDTSPVHRAPEVLALFKTLRDVQITINYPLQEESSITIVQFLTSLPHLRSLTCNPMVFLRCTTEETIHHTSLQRMDITSRPIPLWELFERCIFPSVAELRVGRLDNTRGVENPDLSRPVFDGLDTSCPNVQKLKLDSSRTSSYDDAPAFKFKDFAPLLSLPIQIFDLEVENLNLTPSDLRTISESWPNLHSFTIPAIDESGFDALPYLAAFSNHLHLSHLDLDIRPHFLFNNTKVPNLIVAHTLTQDTRSNPCTVYFVSLGGPDPDEIPIVTRAEKRSLVEYLLLLFPGLKIASKFEPDDCFDGLMSVEFQEILLELRKERGEFNNPV